MAERIVDALLRQGYVRPRVEKSILVEKVAERIRKTFEEEAALEEEAERIVAATARNAPGIDQNRMIQLVKKKLAEERGFPL